jgi:hypothetical protein
MTVSMQCNEGNFRVVVTATRSAELYAHGITAHSVYYARGSSMGERRVRATDVLSDEANEREFNGVIVRKGSVGAFLANVRTLADPAALAEARTGAERDIIEMLPALRALGLFDVFEIKDERLRALVETH